MSMAQPKHDITARRRQGSDRLPPLTMDKEMRNNLQFLSKHEGLDMKTTAKMLFRSKRREIEA